MDDEQPEDLAWPMPEPHAHGGLDKLSKASSRPRRLRVWLAALPLSRPMHSSAELTGLLDEVARLRIDPRRRLALLELARPRARQLDFALESEYLNLPLLPPESALEAAARAQALNDKLAIGYGRVAAALIAGRPAGPARQAAATALQRSLEALGRNLLLHFLLYTPPDPGLWARIHRLYASAELHGLERITVADGEWPGQESSVQVAYTCLLLIASAQPNQLRQPALLALYRAACQWARWVPLFGEYQRDALFVATLDQDQRPLSAATARVSFRQRYFDTRPLAAALAEEGPARGSRALSEPLLRHLRWVWMGPHRRRARREPDQGEVLLCLGLAAVHDRLNQQPDQGEAHRAVRLDSNGAGFQLQWQGATPPTLRAGGLLALREAPAGPWRAGEIRWVSRDRGVCLGVSLLPDDLRPVRVSHDRERPPAAGLLMPAPTATDSDTLMLPSQGFRNGACLTLWDGEPRPVRLGLRVAGTPDVAHYTLQAAESTPLK